MKGEKRGKYGREKEEVKEITELLRKPLRPRGSERLHRNTKGIHTNTSKGSVPAG
jgi:undecaprenyl pyrophosphate synthase